MRPKLGLEAASEEAVISLYLQQRATVALDRTDVVGQEACAQMKNTHRPAQGAVQGAIWQGFQIGLPTVSVIFYGLFDGSDTSVAL